MARDTHFSNLIRPKFVLFVSLIVLFVLPIVQGRRLTRGEKEEEEEERGKLLGEVISAVEKSVNFFAEDYSSINVDGLFGMRVGQGQIVEAVKECKRSRSCPDSLKHRLQDIVDTINTTADAAMAYVQAEDTEYFARFLGVIDRAYHLPYRAETLQNLDSTPIGSDDMYDEDMGDGCMSRIMGTFREDGKEEPVEKCNVTRSCWDMMSKAGGSKYTVTHQLIYFSFIEKEGCREQVETAMKAKVSDTQQRMCGSIYNEALAEAEGDEVPEMFQDLFLEQVLVCGTLGFENFMRSDWMKMVLTWQKPTGCFSFDDPTLVEIEKQVLLSQDMQKQLMKDLQSEAEMIDQQHHTGRKLLREHIMSDGCLAHKTGLGFGALSVFARYLVRHIFLGQ